MRDQFRFYTHD